MSELTDVVTEIAEEVSKQAEGVQQVVKSMYKMKIAFTGLGAAIGVTTGAVIAYTIAYRRAEKKYAQLAEKEIGEMRAHYVAKTEATMSRITKPKLDELVSDLGYTSDDAPEKTVEVVDQRQNTVTNIFKDTPKETDTWDYSSEAKSRTNEFPFVIHKDEFDEGEGDYEQSTLTFYEGDDVLADIHDVIVDDPDNLVGLENLNKFGHGSNDKNVVYVRNVRLKMDMEITRSNGSYSEEVHGFIKHSDIPRGRRRRREWDG